MPDMTKPNPPLEAVLFMNGIYIEHEGKVYRHTFREYPNKKHHHTGFSSLTDLLATRAGAVPIYKGESVTVTF